MAGRALLFTLSFFMKKRVNRHVISSLVVVVNESVVRKALFVSKLSYVAYPSGLIAVSRNDLFSIDVNQ